MSLPCQRLGLGIGVVPGFYPARGRGQGPRQGRKRSNAPTSTATRGTKTRPHRQRPAAHQRGDHRPPRCRHGPRPSSQHPPQPH